MQLELLRIALKDKVVKIYKPVRNIYLLCFFFFSLLSFLLFFFLG